eukprot:SAG22_NODE_1909_length_3328_cov_3.374419_2_plen_92_part_00
MRDQVLGLALTSLTELYLGNNQIPDIAPLSALTSLTSLVIRFNQITDIAPLSALTSLTSLNLYGNPGKFSESIKNNRRLQIHPAVRLEPFV